MIGTKIYKPLQENTTQEFAKVIQKSETGETKTIQVPSGVKPNDAPNTLNKYAEVAEWCNKNNAMIVDQGDYYEAVPVPEPTVQELASRVRSQRDTKLSDTDYLIIPDYPISPEDLEAVKAYRQALRDIPEQSGFPKNVQWPVEPQFLSAKKKKKNEGSIGLAKVGL